jgi:hypothetical protein
MGYEVSNNNSPVKSVRQTVFDYFESHPAAKSEMIRKTNPRLYSEWEASHHYEYKNGETKCWVCGDIHSVRPTRRCPGFEAKYPRHDTGVEGTIQREEVLYMETLKRCRSLVLKRFPRWEDVTGESLAELYHTHGCDPSIVEEVFDCNLPESVHTDFMKMMDKERDRSRSAQVKKVIMVQSDNI